MVGPAHAGKIELLLDRFVAALELDPWLIAPNRPDVDRIELELVERCGGLLAGTIGTFDTLFEALAYGDGEGKRVIGDTERGCCCEGSSKPRRETLRGSRDTRMQWGVRSASSTAACSSRTTSTSRSRPWPTRTAASWSDSTPGIAAHSGATRPSG